MKRSLFVLAALITLLIGRPIHEAAHLAASYPAGITRVAVAVPQLESAHDADSRPHDPTVCPLCASTTQARTALRTASAYDAGLPVAGASLPLIDTARDHAALDPALSTGPPRGPPVFLLVPSV